MSVLIVTKSDDNDSVARVARALVKRGQTPIRLDTDRYPASIAVSTRIDDAGVARSIRASAGAGASTVHLDDVDAVWYRRYHAGGALPESLDDLRPACVDESRRALYGLIAALPCPHVDDLEAVRRCDHKELQLVRARALGLATPKTLFSNAPDDVRAFFDDVSGRMITKMQSSFAVERDGKEHVVFTSVVERHHLDDLEGLRFCPMMFQERIDKKLDVRATVVGDRVLAASLDAGALLDWRQEGVALIPKWRRHALPDDVERALLALVRELGLRYAACDFVVDGAGAHVFLEVNAGGEWFWLDDLLGIADALADELSPGTSAGSAFRRRRAGRA